MGMDVGAVDRALSITLIQRLSSASFASAQIELRLAREQRDMPGDVLFQFRQHAGAAGQIIQRGIRCIAAIAMLAGPAPPGLVLGGDGQACLLQHRVARAGKLGLVKPGDEKRLELAIASPPKLVVV